MWRLADGTPWADTARDADAFYVRVRNFADFRIAPGCIQVASRPSARDSTIRHLLLDQVLPLALAAEGRLVLHASAVRRDDLGIIAVAGGAGAGKSTLAAALANEGWQIVSDDGVEIGDGEGVPIAVPAYAGLRLWPDAVVATGLSGTAVSEVAEYSAKLRVPGLKTGPANAGGHEARPSRLLGVYVIDEGHECRLEVLAPRDAAMALIRHAYRADLEDRGALAAQLEACARLALRVPVARLLVARVFEQLPHAARTLSRHATVDRTD